MFHRRRRKHFFTDENTLHMGEEKYFYGILKNLMRLGKIHLSSGKIRHLRRYLAKDPHIVNNNSSHQRERITIGTGGTSASTNRFWKIIFRRVMGGKKLQNMHWRRKTRRRASLSSSIYSCGRFFFEKNIAQHEGVCLIYSISSSSPT